MPKNILRTLTRNLKFGAVQSCVHAVDLKCFEYNNLVATIGFDTTENRPFEVCQKFVPSADRVLAEPQAQPHAIRSARYVAVGRRARVEERAPGLRALLISTFLCEIHFYKEECIFAARTALSTLKNAFSQIMYSVFSFEKEFSRFQFSIFFVVAIQCSRLSSSLQKRLRPHSRVCQSQRTRSIR